MGRVLEMVMGEKEGIEDGYEDANERERERDLLAKLGERIVLNEGTRVGYVE